MWYHFCAWKQSFPNLRIGRSGMYLFRVSVQVSRPLSFQLDAKLAGGLDESAVESTYYRRNRVAGGFCSKFERLLARESCKPVAVPLKALPRLPTRTQRLQSAAIFVWWNWMAYIVKCDRPNSQIKHRPIHVRQSSAILQSPLLSPIHSARPQYTSNADRHAFRCVWKVVEEWKIEIKRWHEHAWFKLITWIISNA